MKGISFAKTRRPSAVFFASTLLALIAPPTVLADIILEIDLSDSSAIQIQSVPTGLSSTDASLSIAGAGFTIENFFTSAVTYPNTTSMAGNLSPNLGTTFVYNGLGTFDFDANNGDFTAGDDLSFYKDASPSGTQIFSIGIAAFTGTGTVNFSATPGALPGLGATGNVYTGFRQSGLTDHGEVIGQWRVSAVPEPSSLLLFGLTLVGLTRRRRSPLQMTSAR